MKPGNVGLGYDGEYDGDGGGPAGQGQQGAFVVGLVVVAVEA